MKSEREFIWDLMEYAIEYGQKLGAKFVEVRYEELYRTLVNLEKDRVVSVRNPIVRGLGVTIYLDGTKGYGYSCKLDKTGIEETVKHAIKAAKISSKLAKVKLEPAEYKPEKYAGFVPSLKKDPLYVEISEKVEMLKDAVRNTLKKNVLSLRTTYVDLRGLKMFLASDGLKRIWEPYLVGVSAYATVRKDGNIGSNAELKGASRGLELFDEFPIESIISKAISGAEEIAVAKRIKPGKYSLICNPEFAGVIAHESFGHLTEADSIWTKMSILHDKLGEQIGSEHATVIDSGDPINYGWYQPYDDEGIACKTVVILEKGVLKHFLTTRDTAPLLKMDITGNARAIDPFHPPIPRMRNTYFGAGDMSKEELFELIKRGVYVEGSLGGETEPTGIFTFGANRAYWVENGEIKYALKAVNVRAHILDFLKNIIGASKEVFVRGPVLGGCGKRGQAPLPVGLGGPYLAVREAIIGG